MLQNRRFIRNRPKLVLPFGISPTGLRSLLLP